MTEEVIRVREDYYILATSARLDDRTRVLKHGNTFAVFDSLGDIESFGSGELGLYHHDTRFLSRLTLRLENDRPLLLSSNVKDDNVILAVDTMNPDIRRGDAVTVPHGTVHLYRSKFIWNGTCHERLRVHNYGSAAVEFSILLEFDADFADIFEVRGTHRKRRGLRLASEVQPDVVIFAYEGLDKGIRRTRFTFDPSPANLTESEARYDVHLSPGADQEYWYSIGCELHAGAPGTPPEDGRNGSPSAVRDPYEKASHAAAEALARARASDLEIRTSNEQFNDWLNRSLADLTMMRTDTIYGPYPYAGVPWFCTAFGRDGIIGALECIHLNPGLARGVLSYLAARQADAENETQDAQPGKILHETRAGEMSVLGEVPFGCYYGSVDATPLFIVLAGAYYDRTGDSAFVRTIWPNVERALDWIDKYGDIDGDGFVEYHRRSKRGLLQQGWKDSRDSIFHADGTPAEGPIALCEVQGYVFAAKQAASALAEAFGHEVRGRTLAEQAGALQRRFEDAFWCEDLSTYALALDRDKRPCRVRTSNAGHCLFAGIASEEHARRVASTLLSHASFSGWGVRTVAAGEARYNPMSYHNGSVWPHDNALIGAGLSRYGLAEKAARILTGLLDASLFFDQHRLPELFCGFPRRPGESPTLYPVACSPQTWASGAIFMLLDSCLGLKVIAPERRIMFARPYLPESLQRVSLRGLRVGESRVDLLISRHDPGDVSVNVMPREGEVEVVVLK